MDRGRLRWRCIIRSALSGWRRWIYRKLEGGSDEWVGDGGWRGEGKEKTDWRFSTKSLQIVSVHNIVERGQVPKMTLEFLPSSSSSLCPGPTYPFRRQRRRNYRQRYAHHHTYLTDRERVAKGTISPSGVICLFCVGWPGLFVEIRHCWDQGG